jgi:hypothetical protein
VLSAYNYATGEEVWESLESKISNLFSNHNDNWIPDICLSPYCMWFL